MFVTQTNILQPSEIQHLIEIADFEISNFLCIDVPLYQSYDNMHEKYRHDWFFNKLISKVLKVSSVFADVPVTIRSCWFNVCRQDSKFEWHSHPGTRATGVYYLSGCCDNGTILLINNTKMQIIAEDNAVVFFDPNLTHKTPSWSGVDRYTVAFELV